MMGLMVFGTFVLYIAISLWVVFAVLNWAAKRKRSGWWGVLAAFVMYNLVFWDWIPTVLAHKYYCSTQAGFKIYKTPEEWKKENPELMAEDLKPLGKNKEMLWDFPYKPLKSNPNKTVLMINQRIYLDYETKRNILSLLPIHKSTNFILDFKNDQKLAQQITFKSGYGNPMTTGGILGFKGWLANDNCSGLTSGEDAKKTGYTKYIENIINLGEQK